MFLATVYQSNMYRVVYFLISVFEGILDYSSSVLTFLTEEIEILGIGIGFSAGQLIFGAGITVFLGAAAIRFIGDTVIPG